MKTDQFSLEWSRRVAARLRERPVLVNLARENLDRWSRRNADAPALLACYREWQGILDRPLEAICEVLTATTEEGQRLRQNSPFAGVLSAREVWDLKRGFHHAPGSA